MHGNHPVAIPLPGFFISGVFIMSVTIASMPFEPAKSGDIITCCRTNNALYGRQLKVISREVEGHGVLQVNSKLLLCQLLERVYDERKKRWLDIGVTVRIYNNEHWLRVLVSA